MQVFFDGSNAMIQCKDCEYYKEGENGQRIFECDPFKSIKEPECLMKWQLLRLDLLLTHQQAMLASQRKMAPMQDKIFKYLKRELDDIEDTDRWKLEDIPDPDFGPEGDEF
jgi:hypothetical protein